LRCISDRSQGWTLALWRLIGHTAGNSGPGSLDNPSFALKRDLLRSATRARVRLFVNFVALQTLACSSDCGSGESTLAHAGRLQPPREAGKDQLCSGESMWATIPSLNVRPRPAIAAGSLHEREVGDSAPTIRAVARWPAKHDQWRRLWGAAPSLIGPGRSTRFRPDEERSLVGGNADDARLDVLPP
jgi:hypothetical protein